MINDKWDTLTDQQRLEATIKLPSIPKENPVRFRNKYDRLRPFLAWQYELEAISETPGHPDRSLAEKYMLNEQDMMFLKALITILKHNMTYLKHFEQQCRYQVSKNGRRRKNGHSSNLSKKTDV